MSAEPLAVIVMGVTGSGKSTVGARLAALKHWGFYDGDDYHPASNIEKMRRGEALTDQDRAPWLDRLRGGLSATHHGYDGAFRQRRIAFQVDNTVMNSPTDLELSTMTRYFVGIAVD